MTANEGEGGARAAGSVAGRLALGLGLIFALQCALLLAPDSLVISNFEGDALHLLDGVERVARGQVQHVDFRTPLGALNFHLVAVWDAPPGRALALANIAAMAALLPALVWTGASRLGLAGGLALGAAALITAGAFGFGPGAVGATPAMSYNRFGWAGLMAVLPLMLVPPRRPGRGADLADGLALGLIGAALVFVKITFVAALGPVWLIWALGRGRAAAISLGAGLAAGGALAAALGGAEMLAGYAADLAMVAASETRPEPGVGLLALPVQPALAALSLGMLTGVLALLRAGLGREAALFALGSAAIYVIAWQNYGNHVLGALALPLVLLALAPRVSESARAFGAPGRRVMGLSAVAMLAVTAPGMLSVERSLFAPWAGETPVERLFPEAAPDILWGVEDGPPKGLVPIVGGEDPPRSFKGETLPECEQKTGWAEIFADGARALRGAPALRGLTVTVADAVNPLWLPAGAPPQAGAQIWVYA
ncbi:MAG: hypothetical protein ACQEUZ_18115, partial [Pseudomonadota bacterium]